MSESDALVWKVETYIYLWQVPVRSGDGRKIAPLFYVIFSIINYKRSKEKNKISSSSYKLRLHIINLILKKTWYLPNILIFSSSFFLKTLAPSLRARPSSPAPGSPASPATPAASPEMNRWGHIRKLEANSHSSVLTQIENRGSICKSIS